MEADSLKETRELTKKILSLLGLGEAEVSVSEGEEKNLLVNIDGENLGILIGYHGENLSALRVILGLMLYQKTGEWRDVFVDVGGYQAEKKSRFEEMAVRAAEKVRFLQKPISLAPMSAYERRIVHAKVSEIDGVMSESEGEGWERHVVVKPKV